MHYKLCAIASADATKINIPNFKPFQMSLCSDCVKGDNGYCANCLRSDWMKTVCLDRACSLFEEHTFYCNFCEVYWCDSCLQNSAYCHTCEEDHCPQCTLFIPCESCEANGENHIACTSCVQREEWRYKHGVYGCHSIIR